MSEVFGDDFPDTFDAVLKDAEVSAIRRLVEAARELVAILRNRAVAEHERAVRAEREVARLDAHLRTCEAARTSAEVRLAELEVAVTRPAPASAFRHLYRANTPYPGTTECGRPWTQEDAEGQPGRLSLPVCWDCVRALLDRQEEANEKLRRTADTIAAEARGDRQARDQLVQAVRVAIREAVPDA